MAAINEIPGIDESSLQLLEAVGIDSAEELAAQDVDHLVAELKSANETLSLSNRVPGKATVMKWIAGAMELVEDETEFEEFNIEEPKQSKLEPEELEPEPEEPEPASAPAIDRPVNYEARAEVVKMLSQAPCAIPLPGEIMMEKGLSVSDVPVALLLNRYIGDLDIGIDAPALPKVGLPSRLRSSNVEAIAQQAKHRHFDASSAKPVSALPKNIQRVPSSKSGYGEDRVNLLRAPRKETNRDKNPNSRRYIRGVLHTHPFSVRLGAVFTLLLLLNLPLAIVSGFLLLASREQPEFFDWVGEWILVFPFALPVSGLGYLIWGLSGKCRICTQKLYVHKAALKHIKAHRIPGMGYVIPLCLHLLTFSWFRCSSCGTPVRLKK